MEKEIDIRFVIYALISQLANKSQNVMDLSMKEITSKQWLPFIMIERFDHEPTLKELSEKCGLAHQSTKQLLDKLVEKNYVCEKRDKSDKRCLRYSLTEKGHAWGIENLAANQKFMQQLFSDISQEELTTFLSVQKRLLHKLDLFKSDPDYWFKILTDCNVEEP